MILTAFGRSAVGRLGVTSHAAEGTTGQYGMTVRL
jgi:hypothetical protein